MDKYDEAIAYLLSQENFEDAVVDAWGHPFLIKGGILFRYCSPDGNRFYDCVECGCLTQVKAGTDCAYTKEFTEAIRNDPSIPDKPEDVTRESLGVFARWRRELDSELAK